MSRYLVHDIEAIPESDVAGDWKPSAEDIRKAEAEGRDVFPPHWAFKVITIGMLILDRDMMPVKDGCAAGGCAGPATEKDMVERWNAVASGKFPPGEMGEALRLVDWNGRGFDVPVLQYRSFRYNLDMSWYFGRLPDNKGGISSFSKAYRDRYGGRHLDVQELFTNTGAFRAPKMATLAKLMGLPGKTGFDGSDVYVAYKEKRFAEIDNYCMQDVYQTAFVFMRYRLMAGEVSYEAYDLAVKKLYGWLCQKPEQKEFVEKIDLTRVLGNA